MFEDTSGLTYQNKIDIVKQVLKDNWETIKVNLVARFGYSERVNYLDIDRIEIDYFSCWDKSTEVIKAHLLDWLNVGRCSCSDCDTFCVGLTDETRFCDDCMDNNFYCEHCSEYYSGDDYNNIGDYQYCGSCFSDVGYYCDSCGENYENDRPCSCRDHEDDDDNGNDEMKFIIYKNFSKGEYLKVSRGAGIELEFSRFRITDEVKLKNLRGKYFFKTHDGSVRGDSVEIVSSVMKGKLMEEKLKELLSSASVGVDSSCGYHIHINTKDYKPRDIKHLFRTYIDLEKIFFGLVPQSRQENRFCYKFANIYEYNKGFIGQRTKYDLEKKFYSESSKRRVKSRKNYKYDGLRYCWANFHSLFSKNNVEIRLHSGTGNYEKIMNWVALNVAVVQYVKKFGRLQANDIKELLLILLRKDLIAEKTYYFYVDRYNKMKAKRKLYVEEDSN